MKRIIPLIFACIIFCAAVVIYSNAKTDELEKQRNKIIYQNTENRCSCVEAMNEILDDQSILLIKGG